METRHKEEGSEFGSDFSGVAGADSVTAGFSPQNVCGEGASCVVYRMGLDGMRVAVKRLREEYRTRPEFLASYRKEFRIGQLLKHDALPVYRDFRADTQEVYLVMEYIDGESVRDFILTEEGQRFFSSEEKVRRFLLQMVDVVGYLHRSGVIHCDLKAANVMLRRSDRSVMLIDLDKSYSDTLDSTHGGTAHSSDPLSAGERPTAQKDLQAIGALLDYISERDADFPARRFKRFRKECSDTDVTAETLVRALRPQSHSGRWIALTAGLLLAAGACYLSFRTPSEPVATVDSEVRTAGSVVDTVLVRETSLHPINSAGDKNINPEAGNSPVPDSGVGSHRTHRGQVTADFDVRMAEFIRDAERALTELRSGRYATKQQLETLQKSVMRSYETNFDRTKKAYFEENPNLPEMEIEYAVATALQRSRTSEIYGRFMQESTDSILAH